MVICLELGADLHTAQLMPLPLTVSCFSKVQICFTFTVPAHPGIPGQRAIKRVGVGGTAGQANIVLRPLLSQAVTRQARAFLASKLPRNGQNLSG